MMLDAQLGWLAALDLDAAETFGLPAPQFWALLPSHEQPKRNPTSLLFDAFKARIGVCAGAQLAWVSPRCNRGQECNKTRKQSARSKA
ncbi:hypothetical protein [Paraburkholderia youngii]|uniref:Uncharacterized protein n=1 Tax=Paraburkholderia youngii TaxID=2782701 RepID=A0A7W8L500_9BURK|nr:hypothetical protein [Paraburkholderia youngii]MBB5400551.1 hypothetical protein [Paraburkholderia youngii]